RGSTAVRNRIRRSFRSGSRQRRRSAGRGPKERGSGGGTGVPSVVQGGHRSRAPRRRTVGFDRARDQAGGSRGGGFEGLRGGAGGHGGRAQFVGRRRRGRADRGVVLVADPQPQA